MATQDGLANPPPRNGRPSTEPRPRPRLTDEQVRHGLLSRPADVRAHRAGLVVERSGERYNLVDDAGTFILADVELGEVERWLTARGW